MAYRFTNTDKWDDAWFSQLKPIEKLLFIYLCDNCDIAGFVELNLKRWSFDIGSEIKTIEGALKGLGRGLIYSITNDCIYVRTYLRHQKNYPLLPSKNPAHKGILNRFLLYQHKFGYDDPMEFLEGALKGLSSPYGNGNGKDNGNGIPSYRKLFEKILKENDIILPSGFNDLILEWLKYKSEKGQTYKETGLKNFIVKFMNDCEGDYESARAMLLYSISNNYSGLFKEKTNGSVKKLGATKEQLAHLIASTEASDRA